jgi:four helix bundle protein
MIKFRFQDLEIWNMAIEIADELIAISDSLDQRNYFRFAEQLRAAALSVSNNIAEGSGSDSNKEFRYFLNIARRSAFENANILIILERREIITKDRLNELLQKIDHLTRKITKFKNSLAIKK